MEFNSQQAIYLQISDHIRESILKKKWEGDFRIPSVREFAMSLEVNPNTVVRAYNHLQQEDIIYNKRGIGYFISQDAFTKTLKHKKDLFIKTELPLVFKMMDLLSLKFEDLKHHYEHRNKE